MKTFNEIEKQIVELIAHAKNNRDIAQELNLPLEKVVTIIRSIYDRFNVCNRIQLLIVLIKEGLI